MATIGIFDSGIGGVSVYREIQKLLPDCKYIYLADNAYCPYGEKSKEFIMDRCRIVTEFLIGLGADIIVIACNTATVTAISSLREDFPIRFVGVEPAIKPAVLATKSGIIGVLATSTTLKGNKYLEKKTTIPENIQVIERVGQGFVELVEDGDYNSAKAEEVVRASLQPILDAGADTVVLGCTHYPFLRDILFKIAGEKVLFVDSGQAIAKQVKRVLEEENLDTSGPGGIDIYASGSLDALNRIFKMER